MSAACSACELIEGGEAIAGLWLQCDEDARVLQQSAWARRELGGSGALERAMTAGAYALDRQAREYAALALSMGNLLRLVRP